MQNVLTTLLIAVLAAHPEALAGAMFDSSAAISSTETRSGHEAGGPAKARIAEKDLEPSPWSPADEPGSDKSPLAPQAPPSSLRQAGSQEPGKKSAAARDLGSGGSRKEINGIAGSGMGKESIQGVSSEAPLTAQRSPGPKATYYRNEFSFGAAIFSYQALFRSSPTYIAGDLAFSRVFFPASIGKRKTRPPELRGIPVVLRGGVRWAPGPTRGLPLELYVAALLRMRLGPWEPMAGPELGYSGFTRLVSDREYRPSDFFDQEQERVSPLYLSFGVAPARFVVGRWTLSALEFQAGGSLSPLGASRRFHLEVLRLGWSL